jgi:hypothetical protein
MEDKMGRIFFLGMRKKYVMISVAVIVALSSLCVLGGSAIAALQSNIVVIVKGERGDKQGVDVEVSGDTLEAPRTETTGNMGIAVFKGLEVGTYTITPTKDGYDCVPNWKEVTIGNLSRILISGFTIEEELNIPVTEVTLNVSEPANGSHFVVGEKPAVSVILPPGVSKDDFSRLNLYMYGPQETTKTVTAVELLNALTDRETRPHHYIDLVTDPNVDVNGNVLTYNLQAVSDEEPGTYTASLWSVSSDDPLDQAMSLDDFQIGTDTAETQIVDKDKCAQCHLGADNGQFYFHHVDPSSPGSSGYPSLDSWPVRTCKSCHNTEGYAAYRDPEDSEVRVPDPIVNRVHGVHMGEMLENPRNIDPDTGIFQDYIHVNFPADVRNCTYCHVDDRLKTEPSRLACGTCHDNVWFGDPASMPETGEAHPGGPQNDDSACSTCHPSTAIAEHHEAEATAYQYTVDISITPPANGTHYVGGETPQITIMITDTVTGLIVDPATITEADWNRLRLQVSGARENTVPVLTTAALAEKTSSYVYNDLRVRTDPADEDPNVTRSATAITYQLGDVDGLEAGTYTVFVAGRLEERPGGAGYINFQVGTETEEQKIATNCADCHGDTRMHGSYPFNPDVCKNCHDYERQLTGNTGWTDSNWGFGAAPLSRRVHGVHFGHYLDKPEEIHGDEDADHFAGIIFPQDIRNCTKCHDENPMWKEEPSRLACLACHDSDEAIVHGAIMTYDATPEDPWSGDEVETCVVCHGSDADFSPDKMHNISDPYRPPYPREHEEE